MTRPFQEHAELRDLLDALCEEVISPEQVRRLEELVLGHPEAEAYYVQYLSQHAELAAHFTALPALTEQALRDRAGDRLTVAAAPGRVSRLLGRAAFGLAGLAAGLLLALALRQRPALPSGPDEEPGERLDDTVAVLVRAPDAVWGETELPTRPGSPLPPGWLRLKSGFAHLELYSGAAVVIEGPAELRLVSRLEVFCAKGKLRATVPPHARGLKIGSPRMDLIDKGTEFGLQVGGDRTEVHVFQGEVDVYDPGRAGAGPPRKGLITGQGLRMEGVGPGLDIAPVPEAFRTARDVARRAEAETRKRYNEWLAASATWRKDEALLVYYPFEADGRGGRTLLDQARGRREPRDGAIVGCSRVRGRWPGTRALELKGVTDRVRLTVPGEFDSLTLAAWVRIDGLPNLNNALLMADGWEPGEVHWQVLSNGTLVLGVQSNPKGRGMNYHATEAITPDRFGRWLHLAVVYDQARARVIHYVDGEPAVTLPVERDIPLRIGDAEVGNWNLASHRNRTPVRFFSGCIDELMAFSRALSEDEIKQIYTKGRPPL